MNKSIFSVKVLFNKYSESGITEASVSWLICNNKNGFSLCVIKIVPRVLIDLNHFEEWIADQTVNWKAI